MTPEMQVAYVLAQICSAYAEIAAMQCANQEATLNLKPLVYKMQDFRDVPDRFGIGHNSVIGYFTGR